MEIILAPLLLVIGIALSIGVIIVCGGIPTFIFSKALESKNSLLKFLFGNEYFVPFAFFGLMFLFITWISEC